MGGADKLGSMRIARGANNCWCWLNTLEYPHESSFSGSATTRTAINSCRVDFTGVIPSKNLNEQAHMAIGG